MQTKVLRCDCDHKFQDKTYGKNRRVHNYKEKLNRTQPTKWRCTVCGKER